MRRMPVWLVLGVALLLTGCGSGVAAHSSPSPTPSPSPSVSRDPAISKFLLHVASADERCTRALANVNIRFEAYRTLVNSAANDMVVAKRICPWNDHGGQYDLACRWATCTDTEVEYCARAGNAFAHGDSTTCDHNLAIARTWCRRATTAAKAYAAYMHIPLSN